MLNINNEQKNLLLSNIPELEQSITNDDIETVLDLLDDKITEIGFDSNYELNDDGLKLQLLYDQLYNQN